MNYQVGEYLFLRKGDISRLLKGVLQTLGDGDIVADPNISGLLTALAREHREAADKVGDGIEYWVVSSNKDLGYNTKGFRAKQRGRDELVLFSYTDVLRPPTQQAMVAEALTQEAIDITRQLRADAFGDGSAVCADTGQVITDKTLAHAVHRRPPRAQLHRLFLESEGLTYDSVELTKHPTESGFRLADRALADRWRDFQTERLDGMDVVLRRTF